MSEPAEQAVTTTQKKDQAPAKQPDVETAGTEAKTEETPETKAKKLFSGTKIDWNSVLSTIQSDKDVRQAVASSQDYLNKILDCSDKSAKSTIDAILDNLIELINDEATLSRFFTKRFDVSLDPTSFNKTNTVTFGPNGLKSSYEVLRKLPASHVKRLLSLTTDNKSGSSSGVTRNSERIDLSYDENDVTKVDEQDYTNAGDVMEGMVMFDTTLAHEMGHVADYRDRYSRDKNFLKIANWKEYKSPKKVVNTIVDNMKDPFPSELDSDDKDNAKSAAKKIVDDQVTEDSNYDDIIAEEYEDGFFASIGNFFKSFFTSDEDMKKQEEEKKKKVEKKVKLIKGSNLFTHINKAFAGRSPWKRECFSYLPKIQIHQGYENDSWWSYDNDAREKITKNSWYQFRDPGEDFAELYSTYYMGPEKRSQIEPKRLDWFEKTVVKDVQKGK